MKKAKFYPSIWQLVPYSLEMNPWDADGRPIKDLVLTNTHLGRMAVSAMLLNITRFSALDNNGKEHLIKEFPEGFGVPVNGLHRGEFLRSGSVLSLKEGSYTTFRFYLGKAGNKFTYSDKREEPVWGREVLDFKIENGLTIRGGESPEVILRFNLAPFKSPVYFRAIGQLFKRSRQLTARLAGSMGG